MQSTNVHHRWTNSRRLTTEAVKGRYRNMSWQLTTKSWCEADGGQPAGLIISGASGELARISAPMTIARKVSNSTWSYWGSWKSAGSPCLWVFESYQSWSIIGITYGNFCVWDFTALSAFEGRRTHCKWWNCAENKGIPRNRRGFPCVRTCAHVC